MARLANDAPFMYTEDIDPSSSTLIGLYIKTSWPPYDGPALFTPTSASPVEDDTISQTIGSLAEHLSWRSNNDPAPDTTRLQIMNMPLVELEQMRSRLVQLETSVRGLLTKIYGDQSLDQDLAWIYDTSLVCEPINGSEGGRSALYDRYRKLMEVARQPVVPGLTPTHGGALLLQEYGSRLLMLESDRGEPGVAGNSEHAMLRSRPASQSSNERGPFKVEKPVRRSVHNRFGSSDLTARSPVECNVTLVEYQKQLGLLEKENQRRLGESDILGYNKLSYDEQLAILKARNEKRLRMKGLKPAAETSLSPTDKTPADAESRSSNRRADSASHSESSLARKNHSGKGMLPIRSH